MGPIRAAVLIAILQTQHRFRTKRQLWTFSGLGIETHSSADHRYVDGQMRRSKKPISIRGLNQNHNRDLKMYSRVPLSSRPASPVRSKSSARHGWPAGSGQKWHV
jgi:transposase